MPQISRRWLLLTLAFFIIVFCVSFFNRTKQAERSIIQSISVSLALSYVLLLMIMLVFQRNTVSGNRMILPPFYSYIRMLENSNTGKEWRFLALFNAILFMPLGFFLIFEQAGAGNLNKMQKKQGMRSLFSVSAIVGFIVSFIIEILQFTMKRGVFEFDDLLHNTAGSAAGAGIFWILYKAVKGICKVGKKQI